MSKYPFMPLFLGDLLADTLHLGSQCFGAYVLLFCHAWKHDAKIIVKDAQRIARVNNRHWGKVRTILAPFFDPPEGLQGSALEVVHPRVAKELANAAELSNKRSHAAMQMHETRRASASVLHMHPHTHIQKTSLNGFTEPRGSSFEGRAPLRGMSPDQGDVRSPPRKKSTNVLQPIPDKS
jgi:uncharacterized protein YdaU (DUF1376 family)